MRMWVSESGGKKDYVSFLSDTYDKKPILVCESRSLYNACIRNFTIANDQNSSKFSQATRVVREAAEAAFAKLPSQIVVFDDWFSDEEVTKIDYFVMHRPEDSDALFRISKPEGDIAKVQMRAVDNWGNIRTIAPAKLLVLGYDERVRDLFDIIEDGDGGVELRLKTDAVDIHRYRSETAVSDKQDLARLYGASTPNAHREEAAGGDSVFKRTTQDIKSTQEEQDVP